MKRAPKPKKRPTRLRAALLADGSSKRSATSALLAPLSALPPVPRRATARSSAP
jgi:hypothetical protein